MGSKRTLPDATCEQCNEVFRPRYFNSKYCSHSCSLTAQAKNLVSCNHCNGTYRPRNDRQQFCSRTCAYAGRQSQGRTDGWSLSTDGYKVKRIGGVVIREHRRVMEKKLGRPLQKGEYVHHINGNRSDNCPNNLELWSGRKDPKGQRVIDLAREYIKQLLPGDRLALLSEFTNGYQLSHQPG